MSALAAVGAKPQKVPSSVRRELRTQGYVVLPHILSKSEVTKLSASIDEVMMRSPVEGGPEVYRTPPEVLIKNALPLSPEVKSAVFQPEALSIASWFLGGDLKLTYAHVRIPRPQTGVQPLHLDTYEDDLVHPSHYFCGVMWLLDDFTLANGGTRFVPGSHRWHRLPSQHLQPTQRHPGEVVVEAAAGSVVIFDGHVWHGGGENLDGTRRAALFTSWVSRGRHQVDRQRETLSKSFVSGLSTEERWLIDVD